MTEPMIDGCLPYLVRLLPATALGVVLPEQTFGFETPAERDFFVTSWIGACENSDTPLPVEGVDFELSNHGGN